MRCGGFQRHSDEPDTPRKASAVRPRPLIRVAVPKGRLQLLCLSLRVYRGPLAEGKKKEWEFLRKMEEEVCFRQEKQ